MPEHAYAAAITKRENWLLKITKYKQPSLLAPASTQGSASDLIEINSWGSAEACALKILAFLSFQIYQQTKTNSVRNLFVSYQEAALWIRTTIPWFSMDQHLEE